jgi:hypothetical protein
MKIEIEEKCKILIDKGFTYNLNNGKVFNKKGKEIIRKSKTGYIIINGSTHFNGGLFAHHFAWYYTYQNLSFDKIDHINRIRIDNRICNLHSVTNQENCWNTDAKGYFYYKNINKWKAYITLNYKQIHLGYFKTEEEAKIAYKAAKQKYHKL